MYQDFQLTAKRGQVLVHYVLNQQVVHAEVIMDQTVTHTRHLSPRNLRVFFRKLLGDLLCCFTNDLKASHTSICLRYSSAECDIFHILHDMS